MASEPVLELRGAVPILETHRFAHPIDWRIGGGEHWAVLGPNGAGKSLLVDVLLEKTPLREGELRFGGGLTGEQAVKYVSFKSIYSFLDAENSYYQQRWNAGDEQNALYVRELFACGGDIGRMDAGRRPNAKDTPVPTEAARLIDFFGLEDILEERVNMLSSGELRKTLIILSLLTSPRLLVLDNPYIGLDARSRGVLDGLLERLARLEGVQVIAIISRMEDISPIITHVLPVKNRTLLPPIAVAGCGERSVGLAGWGNVLLVPAALRPMLRKRSPSRSPTGRQGAPQALAVPFSAPATLETLAETLFGHPEEATISLPPLVEAEKYENVLLFRDVEIKYGSKTVLQHLDWRVRRGEKWLLWGRNGSGKSTLLGILFGDNPQGYANDIALFDHRRGSGESIWDIKHRIGFISPEIAIYYQKNIPCLEVVGSGFFDTIGSPYPLDGGKRREALRWMEIFGIAALAERPFLRISSGEQQLVLMARLFVKDPDVLVLDEPLNGLDSRNKVMVNLIIEQFCTEGRGKTLIYVTHYEQEVPPIVDHRLEL